VTAAVFRSAIKDTLCRNVAIRLMLGTLMTGPNAAFVHLFQHDITDAS
jgi:hypothetical protein